MRWNFQKQQLRYRILQIDVCVGHRERYTTEKIGALLIHNTRHNQLSLFEIEAHQQNKQSNDMVNTAQHFEYNTDQTVATVMFKQKRKAIKNLRYPSVFWIIRDFGLWETGDEVVLY